MRYSYHLIVNQPLQKASNVLTGILRFILTKDPELKRLEDFWRPIPDGFGLYDSFNCQVCKIGVPTDDIDAPMAFCIDGDWYVPDPDITIGRLADFVEIINDNYSDLYLFQRSPIGYAYYKVEPQ